MKKDERYEILKNNTFGYFEVFPKPTSIELKEYYSEKYYQVPEENNSTYSLKYQKEELDYINNKIDLKYLILCEIFKSKKSYRLLDVGCGEGFSLNFFYEKEWDVLGLDFSDYSISSFHPHLTKKFIKGDIFDSIATLKNNLEKFDVIILDNVLEHVIDPLGLIETTYEMLNDGGVLVVEVPNDFSDLQNALFEKNMIKEKYWVAIPDHLNYFSKESLISACHSVGFKIQKVIGDFPMEWLLANDNSNYVNDKTNGKNAHKARLFIENFLSEKSNKIDLINFYEALSNINQGRLVTGFFQK